MIRNNQKVGKSIISKIIELGTGSIDVGIVSHKKEKYIGITFKERNGVSEIGTKSIDVGMTTDEVTPDTMLLFTKLESIDVVIKKLKEAKIYFKNFK